MTRVAILGCGPAGLLAALATQQAGYDPHIFSIKQKSLMPGAIFLHERIPGLMPTLPDTQIMFSKVGTKQGYARKVYGDENAPCSWDDFPEGLVPAWNLARVYDDLWDMFSEDIVDEKLDGNAVKYGTELTGWEGWDLVMSTVPLPSICLKEHDFQSVDIWVRSQVVQDTDTPIIKYNGSPMDGWYRYSDMFGNVAWEFGHKVGFAEQGKKPLGNNCDCHPGIVRLGRFGKWEKGVLLHHAYQEAVSALQQL